MTKSLQITRRTALRGLGVSMALPLLEVMQPGSILAATPATMPPRRLAWLYVPNGIHMEDWTPATEGANFALPVTLGPLAPFRDYLTVLTGLAADKARPHGDGPGDHARAMSAYLTGCQPRKTSGANIKVGISADQVAAAKVGKVTKFASLEIGCEGGRQAGNCDSGYSCAYSSTISWRSESSPVAKEVNPRQVFERLFSANGGKGVADFKKAGYKKSLLHYVAEEARSLKNRLGSTDQRKLDEYLTGVREIEERLRRAEKVSDAKDVPGGYPAPTGVPKDRKEHLRLMADMLVLAFQADLTRIVTFPFANEGSNRPYREIDVPDGHHDLSHHRGKKDRQEKIQKINQFHIEQVAYLLGKLKAVKEGERSLLDSCLIAYGSGNSDGNRHNHDNLPVILLGKGGGSVKPGRHIRYAKETPVTNLWLSMLDRIGASVPQLGDSTGRVKGLEG
jgi:hypothetical protein